MEIEGWEKSFRENEEEGVHSLLREPVQFCLTDLGIGSVVSSLDSKVPRDFFSHANITVVDSSGYKEENYRNVLCIGHLWKTTQK